MTKIIIVAPSAFDVDEFINLAVKVAIADCRLSADRDLTDFSYYNYEDPQYSVYLATRAKTNY